MKTILSKNIDDANFMAMLKKAIIEAHQCLLSVAEPWAIPVVQNNQIQIIALASQESTIAFEIICSNLHEYQCTIPLELYKKLEFLGQIIVAKNSRLAEIEAPLWTVLEKQIAISEP